MDKNKHRKITTILAIIACIVGCYAGLTLASDDNALFSNDQQKPIAQHPPKIHIIDPAKAGNLPPYFPFKFVRKYKSNPILIPELENGDSFEGHGAFNPAVIRKDGKFYMFYRAQDVYGVSRISLATSDDGMHFTKLGGSVISPTEDYELPGGCEDPRIVQVENMYYLTYTGWNNRPSQDHTPTCLATSTDLIHWKKYGPILPQKSTAILNQKIDGKYWAYYGDSNIWAASSPDMIHWTTYPDVYHPALQPSPGEWDDSIVESGPPPIMTAYGILLIHNGNLSEDRAKKKGERLHRDQVRDYATGWALFDKQHPNIVIARSAEPFLTVTDPFDVYGQVGDVVFTEGMVLDDSGKAYLYYGGADTVVNLAIGEPTWGNIR